MGNKCPVHKIVKLKRPQRRPYPREGDEDLSVSVRSVRDRSISSSSDTLRHAVLRFYMGCHIVTGLTPWSAARLLRVKDRLMLSALSAPSTTSSRPRQTVKCSLISGKRLPLPVSGLQEVLNAQERWTFWVPFEKGEGRARGQRDSTAVQVGRTDQKGKACKKSHVSPHLTSLDDCDKCDWLRRGEMGGHYFTRLLVKRHLATVMPFGGNWTNSFFRKDRR
ncbi:hypothetical protein EDB86DRAFT_2827452 [Lactarius hatsudake]|nr:hypothetical protein EDB86DRAFT_2827452 [Lactarius hatsudake]